MGPEFKNKLYWSATLGDLEAVRALLNSASPTELELEFASSSTDGPNAAKALHAAARHQGKRGLDLVTCLVEAAAREGLETCARYINFPDRTGRRALHVAAENDAGDVVSYLLNHDAQPELTAVVLNGRERTAWELCFAPPTDMRLWEDENLYGRVNHGAIGAFAVKEMEHLEDLLNGRFILSFHNAIARSPTTRQADAESPTIREAATESPTIREPLIKSISIRKISNAFEGGDRPYSWLHVGETRRSWIYAILRELSKTSSNIHKHGFDLLTMLDDNSYKRHECADYIRYREEGFTYAFDDDAYESPPSSKGDDAALRDNIDEDSSSSKAGDTTKGPSSSKVDEATISLSRLREDEASKNPSRSGETNATKCLLSSKEDDATNPTSRSSERLLSSGPRELALGAFAIPLIYSDTLKKLKAREQRYQTSVKTCAYCCSSSADADIHKVFGLHMPLTLDEYCNPNLELDILAARNDDQTMSRAARRKVPMGMELPDSTRLITVGQAWGWKLWNQVITALPYNYPGVKERSISFYTEEGKCDANLAIGLFLSQIVDSLGGPINAGLSEPIFDFYSREIKILSEEVNRYLRNPGVDTMDFSDEIRYIHEISDMREELSMIGSVLDKQEEIWTDIASAAWPQNWKDGRLVAPDESLIWIDIIKPQRMWPKYRRRLDRLDKDAERVENTISTRLDLKAKHTSKAEAHKTAIMSAAIFGFSLITIIFTPLTFVLALFALPINEFQQHQQVSRFTTEAGAYTTNYIGKYVATAELVSVSLTILAMWAAVEFGLGVSVRKWLWERITTKKPAKAGENVESHRRKVGLGFGKSTKASKNVSANGEKEAPGTVTSAEAGVKVQADGKTLSPGAENSTKARAWFGRRKGGRADVEQGKK